MYENQITMSKAELIANYQFRHDIKILKGSVLEISEARKNQLIKAGLVKDNKAIESPNKENEKVKIKN